MDGLDIACCTFYENGQGYEWKLDVAAQYPFEDTWVARLQHIMDQPAEIYAKTHVYFGHWLGKTTRDFIQQHQLTPDFVAAHGQTIFHQPDKNFTAQIGDGESMVSYLPCPLVTNFRNKDVALGGQGAPLVPLGEKYLFPEHDLFLNLGGFSNMTHRELAFDVSACNIVLNFLFRQARPESELDYDQGGALARRGHFHQALFDTLNALPYFHTDPPKSLGWEWVVEEILPLLEASGIPLEDQLHTFVKHVAYQIGKSAAYLGVSQKKMLVSGGGKHHTFLIECMEEALSDLQIGVDHEVSDDIVDYKEAIIFAFLGLRALRGQPTILPSVTGASQASLTGSIHLPPTAKISIL